MKAQNQRLIGAVALAFCAMAYPGAAVADCINNAKSKSGFQRLDSHTILFTGGFGRDFLVDVYCCVYSTSTIFVLKDSFCSYESDALYIDGEAVDLRRVTKLD